MRRASDNAATALAGLPARQMTGTVVPGQGKLTAGGRILAYALLIVVMGSVAAMSWSGVYNFAITQLHWSHQHAVLVPISLDIAAMTCALLALDSIADGEEGTTFRLLAAAFVALSAFINWRDALVSRNLAEEVFFPAMSVLAYLIVHAVMDKVRRKIRRAHHGQAVRKALEPLPRTGLLAWVPGVGYPRRALGVIRASIARRLSETEQRHGIGSADAGAAGERDEFATVDLSGLSQADAIRRAIEAVGSVPRDVVAFLSEHGLPDVATQRVYDVIRRDSVRSVGTGEQQAV
jgi:hypothetical protein